MYCIFFFFLATKSYHAVLTWVVIGIDFFLAMDFEATFEDS